MKEIYSRFEGLEVSYPEVGEFFPCCSISEDRSPLYRTSALDSSSGRTLPNLETE
jgi:hypothetical protein